MIIESLATRLKPTSLRVLLVLSMLNLATATAFADGPPVDRETREVSVPHTLIDLNPSQIEEFETLETVTFLPEQWAALRQNASSCPKRLVSIIPWNLEDCTCGLIGTTYGIALSPTRVALVHGQWSKEALAWQMVECDFAEFWIDHLGQFYHEGALVPYRLLLEAVPEAAKLLEKRPDLRAKLREAEREKPFLAVRLPVDRDRADPALKHRIDELYRVAEASGWETMNKYRKD